MNSIDEDAGSAIVGAVVTMAQALGLAVVAEGVERPNQAARLRLLGCDSAQGYFFARPQPAKAVKALFEHRPAQPRSGLIPEQASR